MSAQRAISGVRRLGKEAYQFQFTSVFEYISLECSGTWRPTQLKVVWFRSHRKVKSIPVQWVASEDSGPNGAVGRAKFRPTFSVGLVVTLYKDKVKDRFDGKEYKYYIQDESERGTKVLASFTIDLKEYTKPQDMGTRDVLEMTFHSESRKVRQVVLGMTLTSQLLKKGDSIDYDMQSTFSALTSDVSSQQLSSGESDDMEEEEQEERETEGGVFKLDLQGTGDAPPVGKRAMNGAGAPIVTMQAPTPGPSPTPRLLHTTRSSLHPSRSPSPLLSHHTPTPSPSPSPHSSPSPPSQLSTATGTATAVSIGRTVEKPTKKAKKPRRNIFGKPRQVTFESGLDQRQDETPLTPPPPSPLPTVTDSAHRPWEEVNDMVAKLRESVAKLESENKRLHASMEVQGWLFKRGVKGVTASVWRRRFFRVEGSRIYYYKTICASRPQGFIDIDLVLGVREVCPEDQDKNCSTFLVRCEGRTFQLQAVDQSTMRKWMRAIGFLVDFRGSYKENRRTDVDIFDTSQL